jgi:hypothetical protein
MAGLGPSTAGVGLGAEKYFAGSRMSVLGAVGYMPTLGASGIGAGVGLRAFTPGQRHRNFAEVAFSALGTAFGSGPSTTEDRVLYGPSVSVGYQFLASSGFTAALSAGVGLELASPDESRVVHTLQIAVGHTRRR